MQNNYPSEHVVVQVYESGAINRRKILPKSGLRINHLAIFSLGCGNMCPISTHDLMVLMLWAHYTVLT